MMIAMPRARVFVLVLLISFSVISYFSFDAYIKPMLMVSRPIHSSAPTVPPIHSSPSILLVSAFFPLSKPTHPPSTYKSWLSRFLQPITTPVYFFTTPDMAPMIQSLRGNLPIIINTTFASPSDIPPLKNGPGTKEKYEEMWSWDRERHRHNPELYAVWTAKPYFLEEGLRNSKFNYDYAFWTDAGSFRDPHSYTSWPDPQRVKEVWEEGSRESGTRVEDLLFFPMSKPPHSSMQYWSEGMGPINNEFSESSFFGGSARTIKWWRSIYFNYHDQYLSRSIFVGKDQTLVNALFLLNPKKILSVWLGDPTPPPPPPTAPDLSAADHSEAHSTRSLFQMTEKGTPLGACGKTRFYYQFFLASESEREEMRRRWGTGSIWGWEFWPWRWNWWTGVGEQHDGRCRLTRVVAMESLLKRVFGKGWSAPESSFSGS